MVMECVRRTIAMTELYIREDTIKTEFKTVIQNL